MKTKNTLATLVLTGMIVLLTGTFALAQGLATQVGAFPYFQLGCLILGGGIMLSLKNKYDRIFTSEAVGVFALYTLFVALFTNPVIDAIKSLVS